MSKRWSTLMIAAPLAFLSACGEGSLSGADFMAGEQPASLMPVGPSGLAVLPPATVKTYSWPGVLAPVEHLAKSVEYTVTVNGKTSFVYETDNHWANAARMDADKAAFTYFDFDGGVATVEITANFAVSSVMIRPKSDGVTYTQTGNKITFELTEPKQLVVELNDRKRPLLIFAERPEVPDTTAQHYFAKGVHYIGPKYRVAAGERVYIEGGAVVEGTLLLEGDNIKIGGRGILSAGQWTWDAWNLDKTLSILTDTTGTTHNNHTYSGIILLNSPGWNMNGYGKFKTISHLKVISWVGNSDGPHLNGDGVYEDSFIFNNDDGLITNMGNNNVFRNNVVWKGPWGRPMVSLNPNNQDGVLYEDIDVINNEMGPGKFGQMGIIEAGGAVKKNYIFRNIRIEAPTTSRLFFIDANATTVSNVSVETVTSAVSNADEGALNASNGGSISTVAFKCIKQNGVVATSLAGARMTKTGPVTGVTFTGCP